MGLRNYFRREGRAERSRGVVRRLFAWLISGFAGVARVVGMALQGSSVLLRGGVVIILKSRIASLLWLPDLDRSTAKGD